MTTRPYISENILWIGFFALFVGSRFIGISSQSLWLDEINLARIANEIKLSGNLFADISGLFQLIKIEPHPPLYFVICSIWTSIFGASLIALRTLSIVWIAFLFILLGVWSFRKYGSRFTCLLLVLFSFAPIFFHESQNFRPYTFNMLMGGAIGIAYFYFLENTNPWKRFLPLCLAVLIASLSHYSAVIFALAVAGHQFLSGIINQPKNYMRYFVNSIVIMLATLPSLLWYAATYEAMYFRHAGDISKTRDFLDYISIFRAFTGFPGLFLVLILPIVGGSDSLWRNAKNIITRLSNDHMFITIMGVAVLFYILIIIASVAQPSILQNKNMLMAMPLVLIAFAKYVLVFADDIRIFRLAAALAAIGFITYLVTGYSHHKPSYFQPWREQVREVAGVIKDQAVPGDIIIFGTVSMNGYLLQPTKTYLTLIEGRTAELTGLDIINFPPEKTYIVDQRDSDISQRQALLSDALLKIRRDPSRRLFIDLPHEQQLSVTENELLIKSGFCVQAIDFIYERIMLIENLAAPKTCVTWSRVSGFSRVRASARGS